MSLLQDQPRAFLCYGEANLTLDSHVGYPIALKLKGSPKSQPERASSQVQVLQGTGPGGLGGVGGEWGWGRSKELTKVPSKRKNQYQNICIQGTPMAVTADPAK